MSSNKTFKRETSSIAVPTTFSILVRALTSDKLYNRLLKITNLKFIELLCSTYCRSIDLCSTSTFAQIYYK